MRIHLFHGLAISLYVLLLGTSAVRAQEGATPVLTTPVGAEQLDGEQVVTPSALPADTSTTTPSQAPAAPTAAASNSQISTQNSVPSVEHTGLETLVRDTLNDFKAFPTRKSTWVILGMGGALAAALHPFDDDVNAHLVSSGAADKIWAPGHIIGGSLMYAIPPAMYITGRYVLPKFDHDESQTNKWSHLGLDLVRAEILEETIVQGLKLSVRRTRPDGTPYSFPSGHAAATFALAAVVERHLGYRLALPTIAIATYVGTSRLHDNVHFLSDVAFGAAVGTAAGWTVVGRHGRTNYALEPTPVRGGFAVMVTRRAADSD